MNNKRRIIHDFITSVQFMEKGLQKWQQTTNKHHQKKILSIPVNYFGR